MKLEDVFYAFWFFIIKINELSKIIVIYFFVIIFKCIKFNNIVIIILIVMNI
jgi:hypothetical protein